MITKVRIQNFKSVEDLTIELGQVNVIIGANGTGKSNILEGIAMGAAALEAPLTLEYRDISSRIRTMEAAGMISGFSNPIPEAIELEFESDEDVTRWVERLTAQAKDTRSWIVGIHDFTPIDGESFYNELQYLQRLVTKKTGNLEDLTLQAFMYWTFLKDVSLRSFLTYAPEETQLRRLEELGQISPLGLRGEGLFYELKQIFTRPEKAEQLAEIKEHLELFDWYEDMELPNGLLSMEYRLSIKDRYRAKGLDALDQRSANEGFLFWLFYLVLFTSEHTPQFFAIDNIETAFNPLLCTEIIFRLTQLAKKHNKQVIFTTHNPAILDGIDLKDDQQRLFVTSRGNKGQTRIRRIDQKPKEGIKLSELWMKGYIGGIPSNF
jgi:predicted ATPase